MSRRRDRRSGDAEPTISTQHHGLPENLAYLGFLLVATVVSGAYFEHSPRYAMLETARALGCVAMLAVTDTWFGRSLDAFSTLLIVLAGANLIAAWAFVIAGRPELVTSGTFRSARRSTVRDRG